MTENLSEALQQWEPADTFFKKEEKKVKGNFGEHKLYPHHSSAGAQVCSDTPDLVPSSPHEKGPSGLTLGPQPGLPAHSSPCTMHTAEESGHLLCLQWKPLINHLSFLFSYVKTWVNASNFRYLTHLPSSSIYLEKAAAMS